ncbi:nitrate reductase [Flavihumibacter petaseus]|uniref:nitrate reductase (cytochrome) n=1 Tax=Flavihumibacter petaseus NBRC 106054 TaxID=1220578 RepID=A0A0E9N4R5_9BACT|nr:nitrate reductase [Flavihumibacter petaseus]GAO44824.1 nitrate reductase [Flavihumibacter petaseus NBRC 106054]
MKTVRTTCCYCGVGCGILVSKDRQGKIMVEGDPDHPVNKGMLCSKGMNLHHTLTDDSDRLLFPEMRYGRNLPRQRVSWDAALERTAAVFTAIIKRHGPDAVAFYASGQCLTEEYYVVNKLIKGFIGSNNIDTNSRLCMSSAVVGYKMSLGEDSVPACYDDIEHTDCLFVAGANPAWCHPILWRRVEAAKAANPKLRIILSDPRVTQSAALADCHLQIQPGTDITLHHAMARCLIENGDIDLRFIRYHTEGFEKLQDTVMVRTVEEAAQLCGIEAEQIREAARLIGNAGAFLSMWTMGLNQSVVGVNKNLSLINLHLITGQIGKPGAGPLSLTGQPNAMGGREVGGLSNLLPAHRDLNNPQHRREVQEYWQSGPIAPQPGLTATEMFSALREGRLKAIWLLCTNPLVSLPDVRMAEEALKQAKFVVVQDISNRPETLAYADVILPAAGWTEKTGTMTNAERRITLLEQLREPPGEALPDAEIICRFAQKMGFHGFDYKDPGEIFREHIQLTKGTNIDFSGIDYALLRRHRSLQWPFPEIKDPAAEPASTGSSGRRLFSDHQFPTASGKAIIHDVPDDNDSEKTTPEFPLILTTGRIRDQWHTMSKTGKVNKLKQHIREPFLEIHPEDARRRSIRENDLVEVISPRGKVRVKAKLTTTIKKGVVFLPMHWGKQKDNDLLRANNLTANVVDPMSKEPDFKFTAVAVHRYIPPVRRIIVVGAGAGAHGFVKSHRALNKEDTIQVFSRENLPFYNRVLLPDYINGAMPWKQLVKMTVEDEQRHNIQLHRGISIVAIDRKQKTVTDDQGITHAYDRLILGMGSRSATLRDLPPMNGIFTIRSRSDADQLMAHLLPDGRPVGIVGGGLLGIELAASLREARFNVFLLHRSSRLMDRQLDALGSQLLQEELENKGIDVCCNDEIERCLGMETIEGVRLRSGLQKFCQALVTSIGTQPNTELAKAASLELGRGVVVNEFMQTSDPDIFAIGEIAEFRGAMFGITAAAEQQAAVVASFLNGDVSHRYDGSLLMNILKVHGTEICSLGITECPDLPGYEEVVFIDKAQRYYKKCIIYKDRLVGAILMGDKSEFLEFRDLIQQKLELSEKRLQLLRSGKKSEPVLGKLVCSCSSVGEGNLLSRIEAGCTDLLQLCQLTGAGMGCGSCRSEVKNILENTTGM